MIAINKLVDIAEENGIHLYETNFCFDEYIDIRLKEQNISTLIQIAKDNNIKSLFYAYDFVEKEEFEIFDDDLIEKFDEITEMLQNAKNRYNESIEQLDFSKPTALAVYIAMNGLQIGIVFKDSWDEKLPSKETYLNLLEREMDRSYEQESEDYRKKKEKVLEEMIEFLRSTDEWHYCTNQRLRADYCRKLVARYNEKYDVDLYCSSIDLELEILWGQYKNNK